MELNYKMEHVHMCIRWFCSKNEPIAIGVILCTGDSQNILHSQSVLVW
jgi:hypothetical protein